MLERIDKIFIAGCLLLVAGGILHFLPLAGGGLAVMIYAIVCAYMGKG